MRTHSLLSSMVTAAPDPSTGPDLEDAIASAYDWHQNAGGLYAFASNGGKIADETVRETALQEVEEAMAFVQSRTADIDAGTLPEFQADLTEAQKRGTSASGYILGRLENLKTVLNQDKPAAPEAASPAPTPTPEAPTPAPVMGSASKEAKTVISVEVFNKARQIAQDMLQKVKGSKSDTERKVSEIIYELDDIETKAGGDLTRALDSDEDPTVSAHAHELISTLAALQHEVAEAPVPAPEAEPAGVQGSLEVTADLVDNTVRSVAQFVRINLNRFKQQLQTPQGVAAVREELSRAPGGQMAGPVTPLVQQLAQGALDENGFVARLEQLFQRGRRSASEVKDYLVENKLATDQTRVKATVDGCVHVMGLKAGANTLRHLVKFASANKISVKLVKAFEDDDEDTTCPECGGPGVPLGGLGNMMHYRCRDCGMGFHHEAGKNASVETQQPVQVRSEELPFTEGGAPARDDESVFEDLHTAAGPEPENHVIKVGTRYLAIGDDVSDTYNGGTKLTLVATQKEATKLNHSMAELWLSDDRFSQMLAADSQSGEEARIVRIVPKQASAKTALIPPAPSAAGNHTGPANPVNPTGTPAPVAPAPVAQPAPTQPSTQGPAVNHINPGGSTPAAPATPVPPPVAGQPPVDANGQPIQGSLHTASEGTLNGVLAEAEGSITAIQELADTALAKARLMNDEPLVAAVERMNTAIFEAGMAARHAKGLAGGTTVADKDEPKDEDKDQKPGELKEASEKRTQCVDCDKSGLVKDMPKNNEGAGYVCNSCLNKRRKEDDKAKRASSKVACSGAGCKGDCDGNCKGECKGDCPSCKNKKASARTADNAELSSMAREVVLDWAATHPKQAPDWASPEWRQLYEQNRAEAPDENQFLQACQRAYGEMAKSMNKQGSLVVAALALQARGLMGPDADEGDTVENAVKFIHGNAKDIEDETVSGLRQILGDAGYDRTNAEMAIEEVFGEGATLANGALLKTLLKAEG